MCTWEDWPLALAASLPVLPAAQLVSHIPTSKHTLWEYLLQAFIQDTILSYRY